MQTDFISNLSFPLSASSDQSQSLVFDNSSLYSETLFNFDIPSFPDLNSATLSELETPSSSSSPSNNFSSFNNTSNSNISNIMESVGNKRKLPPSKEKKPVKRQKVDSIDDNIDDDKVKRQKRLVKNREAAQLFRQRQKNYIQDLEKKVEDLIQTNQQFTTKAELLESENRLLRDQLTYLRTFLSQIMSTVVPQGTTMPQQQNLNFQLPNTNITSLNVPSSSSLNDSMSSPNILQESNPAASVAAAFQAAMGLQNPNTNTNNNNNNTHTPPTE